MSGRVLDINVILEVASWPAGYGLAIVSTDPEEGQELGVPMVVVKEPEGMYAQTEHGEQIIWHRHIDPDVDPDMGRQFNRALLDALDYVRERIRLSRL